MQLSTIQETVTVTGDSPMIEVNKASNVLNIDGEFQRAMPIQARRNYSDFLELTPGVISRGFDDGSGRQVYFGHATEHFAHVLQLEGTIASNYHDAQLTYVSMGADMVADTQVKTGGVDAAEPMGTGLVMNIITKSGGNTFRGSAAYAYQPYDWNGNNVDNCSAAPGCKPGSGGTPTTAYVRQFDGSFGGPIKRDQVWFFGALRRALSSSGISRTSAEVARIEAYKPGAELFDNDSESWQPFFKVTSRVGRHDVQGFYQRDRLLLTGDREYNYEPIMAQSTGGSLYSGKITSVWGQSVTTTFTGSYNNKGGNDVNTFEALGLSGPQIVIHDSATPSGATLQGSGAHSRRRQPAVLLLSAGIADHHPRRSHLVQGRLGRQPPVPDRPLRGATQHLRPGDPIRQRRLRARRAAPPRLRGRGQRHDSIPPPLPVAGEPDDARGSGSGHRHLRPGHVAPERAAHNQRRRPRRLRPAL